MIFWFSLLLVLGVGIGFLMVLKNLREGGSPQRAAVSEESQSGTERKGISQKIPEEAAESQKEDGSPSGEEALQAEETGEEVSEPAPNYPVSSVSLAFAGDILFDPNYAVMAQINQNGGGISSAFSPELMEKMREADFFLINNEFPYSRRGTPLPDKAFTFRADPSSARYLEDMGVDLVGLANNHASDYGEPSLLDTLDTLEQMGMPYIGAGRNLQEASAPYFYEVGDYRIGFLAATQIEKLDNPDTKGATDASPGVFRCWNPKKLLEVIAETKAQCDFLVVFIHWGSENVEEIDWAQIEQGPKIAEAGADLIVGSHPHILQKIDVVKGVPVVYSLGNYLFNSRTLDTGLLWAEITPGEGISELRFLPTRQENCKARLLAGEDKEQVLAHLRNISPGVKIDGDGVITW